MNSAEELQSIIDDLEENNALADAYIAELKAEIAQLREARIQQSQCEHDWSFDGESSDHSKGHFNCIKCGTESVSNSISEDALHILKNATKEEIEAVSKFGGLHDLLEVMNELVASASTNEKDATGSVTLGRANFNYCVIEIRDGTNECFVTVDECKMFQDYYSLPTDGMSHHQARDQAIAKAMSKALSATQEKKA